MSNSLHLEMAPPRFGGPNIELQKILGTSEVRDFKIAHNIGPLDGFRLPGDATSYTRYVPGALENVTVAQALDYVLRTFPGYWLYGNCENKVGGREAFFWFIQNTPKTEIQSSSRELKTKTTAANK